LSTTALVLVLVAAFAHAAWNLLAKTATGGAVFVWLTATTSALLLAPAAVFALVADGGAGLDARGVAFMAGSGALHAGYFVLLQRGYRVGDLSLVYPLARGLGPLLATLAAVLLLGERPSALALAGGAVIVLAVLSLAGGARRPGGAGPEAAEAVGYALATGVFIAGYTLWDKHAVGPLGLSPVVYFWGTIACNAALLTPVVLRRPAAARRTWRENRRAVVGVGVLSPLAYVLVLYALVSAPVSYVAPAREVSILIGAALGAQLLAEGDVRRRLACAGAIVLGVAALAIG
jgi:drug/metabolite transporter (DMT)-like permease